MLERDYLNEDTTGYGSHIAPLDFIFKYIEVNNAIEMGMGFFSTSFLLHHVKESLLSIEMQDKSWLDKVVDKYTNPKIRWVTIFDKDPLVLSSLSGMADFILVDGASLSRPISCYISMRDGIETIVAHDTESPWYGYSPLEEYAKEFGYFEYEFRDKAPYTRVYTKNQTLINALNDR